MSLWCVVLWLNLLRLVGFVELDAREVNRSPDKGKQDRDHDHNRGDQGDPPCDPELLGGIVS